MEEVVTFAQGIHKILIIVDLDSGDLTETSNICFIFLRVSNIHCLVRSPGRKNLHSERMFIDHLVVFKAVGRIVSGADHLHIESLHQFLAPVFLSPELCSTFLINRPCSLRVEKFINTEHACELEMSPMIERIPHSIWNGLSPFFEFLIAAALSCDEFLRNAVSPHSSPFVVVST